MHIALYHNLPSGGAKRAVYEWIRRLSIPDGPHTFSAFSLSSADHEFCDIRPLVQSSRIYPFTPRPLFKSPFGRLNYYQRWRDLQDLEKLHHQIAQKINSQGFDLAFINPSLFTHVPPILEHLKIPCIYYLHEPVGKADQREIQRPYLSRSASGASSGYRGWLDKADPFLKRYQDCLAAIQQRNLNAATLLLANSHFTAERMKALQLSTQQLPQVCYLGVNTQFFQPFPEARKSAPVEAHVKGYHIFSAGELTPRKGFDFLIESLGRIPTELRPSLRIASNWEDPQERSYLSGLADSKKVLVHFLGRLDNEALRKEYTQARLCVYTPVQEPFGLVPLEAMACGTVVVGIAEGGVLETIEDQVTGLLVERDPEQFARAIMELLGDQTRREQMAAASREAVLIRWNWDQAVERLDAWFEQVSRQIAQIGAPIPMGLQQQT